MLGAAQTNYRGRAYKIFIINANMILRGSFKIIYMMLDEFTAQKINLMGKDFKKKLLETIDEGCLEERFGGTLPNKTSDYFPPDMSMPNEKMITIKEAKERLGLTELEGVVRQL